MPETTETKPAVKAFELSFMEIWQRLSKKLDEIGLANARLMEQSMAYGDEVWSGDSWPRVEDTYRASVIIALEDKFFQASYSVDPDTGDVTLQPQLEWTEVRQDWVAKALRGVRVLKSVKAENGDDLVTVGGWGVVFGGQDLYGEHFTKDTDLWLDKLPGPRPVLWDHSLDPTMGLRCLGQTVKQVVTDAGVWIETQLSKADAYQKMVLQLIEQGVVGISTGAPPHLVRMEGKAIKSWPICEYSLTPMPAEPRTLGVESFKAILAYAESLKGLTPEEAGGRGGQPLDASAEQAKQSTEATRAAVTAEQSDEQTASTAKEEVKAMPDVIASPVMPTDEQLAGLLDQRIADAVKAALENAPAFKTAPYVVPYAVKSKDGQVDEVKTFDRWLRVGGQPYRAYKAAMQEGTDSEGGYAVPSQLVPGLITDIQAFSVLRRAGARVIPVSWWKANIPALTNSAAAVLTAEEGAFSEIEPTLGTIALQQYKFTRIAKVAEEMLSDSQVDVWGQIIQPDYAQAFAKAENAYFSTGTGSSQPQGFVSGGTKALTTAGATAITADEVIDLYYALPEAHRNNAIWMANDSTFKYIRKLKDGNGDYLWERAFNGQPGTIMGRPVVTNADMDAIAANKNVLAFGDFSYFWVFDRQDLQIQRLNELYAANGQVGFRAFKRFTSAVVLATAIQYMTTHA